MNNVILLWSMTKDEEVRRGDSDSIFARFNLAVDRRFKKEVDEQSADFISCVVFGRRNGLSSSGKVFLSFNPCSIIMRWLYDKCLWCLFPLSAQADNHICVITEVNEGVHK